MKRRFFLFALILSCCLDAQAQSKAVVSEQTHDFGNVVQGEKLQQAFAIRNDGKAPLQIDLKGFSIQGLTARFKEKIEPGMQASIKMEWNTLFEKPGTKIAEAAFTTNDPAQPMISITLKATVSEPFSFEPMKAFFFSVWKGESLERTVRISSREPDPRKVVRLEPRGTHFQAKLKPVENGKAYDVVVTVPASTPAGRYMESLKIYTDHPKLTAGFELPVNIFVKDEMYTSPDVLEFGTIDRTKVAPTMVQYLTDMIVVKKRQGDFAIKEIRNPYPFLKITQNPLNGKSQIFELQVDVILEKLVPGKIAGDIVIVTDNSQFPELRVPLTGEVL